MNPIRNVPNVKRQSREWMTVYDFVKCPLTDIKSTNMLLNVINVRNVRTFLRVRKKNYTTQRDIVNSLRQVLLYIVDMVILRRTDKPNYTLNYFCSLWKGTTLNGMNVFPVGANSLHESNRKQISYLPCKKWWKIYKLYPVPLKWVKMYYFLPGYPHRISTF